METIRKQCEPLLATLATGASSTGALDQVDHALSILVTLATLAWWLRLWLKNPKQAPPAIKPDEKR